MTRRKPPGNPQKSLCVGSQSTLITHPTYGILNLCAECGEYWPLTAFPIRKRDDGSIRFASQCRAHYGERKVFLQRFRDGNVENVSYNERQSLAILLRHQWARCCASIDGELNRTLEYIIKFEEEVKTNDPAS